MKLVYALLALAFLKCIVLYKVYHSIPALELKRRARSGDARATKLYKVAAYGPAQDMLLWIVGTVGSAILLIWSARTNWWLTAFVVVLTAWLVAWAKFSAEGWAGRYAAIFAPVHAWFLALTQPILGRVAGLLPPGRQTHIHTGLYEKKDWLDLLSRQNKQADNRIPQNDLNIAANALTFGDKSVGTIMIPRDKIRIVKADETAGPMLMDELHKTGLTRFPVVKVSTKSSSPDIIGTLYLNNLIGYDGSGKVKDLMRAEAYYINEDSTVRQALSAFLKTHHHLLIVINSFEEMVGMLSLEDVLEQILGKQIVDEFESYENLRAVAAGHKKAEPEQTEESVVES